MGKSFWERQNSREHSLNLAAEIIEVPLPRNIWALEGRGLQENYLIFKDHLLQLQEQSNSPNKQEVRQKCQEACMDEQGAPGKTET